MPESCHKHSAKKKVNWAKNEGFSFASFDLRRAIQPKIDAHTQKAKFDSTVIEKTLKNIFRGDYRESEYRGVARNCKSAWQVLCQLERKQEFIWTFEDKKVAAIIFDMFQIQYKGRKARTNFNYSLKDIFAIMSLGCLMEYRDISNP